MPKLSELGKNLQLPGSWTPIGKPAAAVNDNGIPIPGQYTIVLSGPGGATRRVALTAERTGDAAPGFPYREGYDPIPDMGDDVDFTVVDVEKQDAGTNAEETNARIAAAQASTAAANLQADRARLELEKTQREAQEALANEAKGLGYRTNDQIEISNKNAADQGLNADQIAVQRAAMENTNRNTIASNQIAATNAATGALNAASQARATEARTRFEEGQLGLDQVKFEWQKSQDEIKQQNDTRDSSLRELQQSQTNQVQQRQNELREEEMKTTAGTAAATLEQRREEAGATLEQRKAEAAQQAETSGLTAATTAAANVYGTERQAQTAAGTIGGNVLSNQATQANSLLNNILGMTGTAAQGSAGRYGTLGGGLQGAMPAGFGAALVGGVQGLTTQQFGGQETLDAAARMVRGAQPGAETTPQGQAAIGVLSQAFERYGQLAGRPHPAAAATQAAQATQQAGGMAAPVTAAGGMSPPTVAQPGPQPRTWRTPAETADQSFQRNNGGMLAPVTINIGGSPG